MADSDTAERAVCLTAIIRKDQTEDNLISNKICKVSRKLTMADILDGAVADIVDGAVADILDGAVADIVDGAVADIVDGAVADILDGAVADILDGAVANIVDGADLRIDDEVNYALDHNNFSCKLYENENSTITFTVDPNETFATYCAATGTEKDASLCNQFRVMLPICVACRNMNKPARKRKPIK